MRANDIEEVEVMPTAQKRNLEETLKYARERFRERQELLGKMKNGTREPA